MNQILWLVIVISHLIATALSWICVFIDMPFARDPAVLDFFICLPIVTTNILMAGRAPAYLINPCSIYFDAAHQISMQLRAFYVQYAHKCGWTRVWMNMSFFSPAAIIYLLLARELVYDFPFSVCIHLFYYARGIMTELICISYRQSRSTNDVVAWLRTMGPHRTFERVYFLLHMPFHDMLCSDIWQIRYDKYELAALRHRIESDCVQTLVDHWHDRDVYMDPLNHLVSISLTNACQFWPYTSLHYILRKAEIRHYKRDKREWIEKYQHLQDCLAGIHQLSSSAYVIAECVYGTKPRDPRLDSPVY